MSETPLYVPTTLHTVGPMDFPLPGYLINSCVVRCVKTVRQRSIIFARTALRSIAASNTMETTQGQINGFLSQLPFKCYLPEVVSVGN